MIEKNYMDFSTSRKKNLNFKYYCTIKNLKVLF